MSQLAFTFPPEAVESQTRVTLRLPRQRGSRPRRQVLSPTLPPRDPAAPTTWSECMGSDGPCPWVGCKHHLYLDVNPETGSIKLNFPDLEPWELERPCVLRIATVGGLTLEEAGELMQLTRERVRQIEVRGLLKLRMAADPEDFAP